MERSDEKSTRDLQIYKLGRYDGVWVNVDDIDNNNKTATEMEKSKKKEDAIKGKRLGLKDGGA